MSTPPACHLGGPPQMVVNGREQFVGSAMSTHFKGHLRMKRGGLI